MDRMIEQIAGASWLIIVAVLGCNKADDRKPASLSLQNNTSAPPLLAPPPAQAPAPPAPLVPGTIVELEGVGVVGLNPRLVEFELSPAGENFKDLVITAPEGSSLSFYVPTDGVPQDCHVAWRPSGTDGPSGYVIVGLAPGWQSVVDQIGDSDHPHDQNIVITAGKLARWQTQHDLWRAWRVDLLFRSAGKMYSCNNSGGAFDKASADFQEVVCRSLKEKRK